jgi:hypothetical protein
VLEYGRRLIFETDPSVTLTLAVGALALLALHWLAWVFPSLLDLRHASGLRGRRNPFRGRPDLQAVILFLAVTLVISALMAAIFIRNEGNKSFPESVPDYHRLIASADSVLLIGFCTLVLAPGTPRLSKRVEGALAVAKTITVAAMLLAAWPSVADESGARRHSYDQLDAFLEGNGVTDVYSEATFVLEPNLPRYAWHALTVDFTGPALDFNAAGMPDGATLVTVGSCEAADARFGDFSVIIRYDRTDPPSVWNPFHTP